MTLHTYTAADFQNLDPDALKALGVEVEIWKGSDIMVLKGIGWTSTPYYDHAAALLIGMVAGRCEKFLVEGSIDGKAFVSECCGNDGYFCCDPHPSPLAAALAAYGELVRSQRKEDGDGK